MAVDSLILFCLALAGYLLWQVATSPIPLLYNLKSVLVRWRSTAATILGVARMSVVEGLKTLD